MKLIIDVNALAGVDFLKLAKAKDTLYKRCSRYLTYLVSEISIQLQVEDYKRQSVSSSLEYTDFIYVKESDTRKITERLSFNEPVKASVEVDVSADNLPRMQAFLKNIKIPSRVISIE